VKDTYSNGVGTVLEALNVVGTAVEVPAGAELALVGQVGNVFEDGIAGGVRARGSVEATYGISRTRAPCLMTGRLPNRTVPSAFIFSNAAASTGISLYFCTTVSGS
jgi:hypothetical protein